MEKTAVSGLSTQDVQLGGEAGYSSGVMRASAATSSLDATFVGRITQAIRTAAAARGASTVVLPFSACTPYGLSFDQGGVRAIVPDSELLRALETAQSDSRAIYVESQGDAAFSAVSAGDASSGGALCDRAWVLLRDEEGVFGVVGLCRDENDGPFTSAQRGKLEELSFLLACCARAELSAIDAKCELSIVRALGSAHSTHLLFDRDCERVVWASSMGTSFDWAADIAPVEKLLARTIEQFVEAQSSDEILPTPPRLQLGIVVAVAPVQEETPFGGHCTAVGIKVPDEDPHPIDQLSARERAVARLLVKGYEPANIAAITGIAEHTVRTYIRRAYKKLGVCRRADLVRRLLAPEPGAGCAPRK